MKDALTKRSTADLTKHAGGDSSEGELKSVTEAHNFACLNKVEKPLSQVRCDVWRGFIFINFDDNARPLEDFMAPLSKQIQDFPLDDMIVKDVITVELDRKSTRLNSSH